MDPYLGEVRIFASNFAPVDWAFCDGQLLAIREYEALFALLGTTYGGDGRTNFALPDFRGLLACGVGQGAGLAFNYALGQTVGAPQVTLTQATMPAHSHPVAASRNPAAAATPGGMLMATAPASYALYANRATATKRTLEATAVSEDGGGQAHQNMMPAIAINYIICVRGLFPG